MPLPGFFYFFFDKKAQYSKKINKFAKALCVLGCNAAMLLQALEQSAPGLTGTSVRNGNVRRT